MAKNGIKLNNNTTKVMVVTNDERNISAVKLCSAEVFFNKNVCHKKWKAMC